MFIMCPHNNNNTCNIVTKLTGLPPAVIPDLACAKCASQDKPQQENIVTAGLAFIQQSKHSAKISRHTLALLGATSYDGPGTELKKLISWFPIPKKESCSRCSSLEKKMNRWGPNMCEQKKEYIIKKLKIAARRRNLPFSEHLVTILIDKAIRNSR